MRLHWARVNSRGRTHASHAGVPDQSLAPHGPLRARSDPRAQTRGSPGYCLYLAPTPKMKIKREYPENIGHFK